MRETWNNLAEDKRKVELVIADKFKEFGPFNIAAEKEHDYTGKIMYTGLFLVHFYRVGIIIRTLWGDDFSIRRLGYFNQEQVKALMNVAISLRDK